MLIKINIVLLFIDYTICSLSGRPYTPLPRVSKDHPLISEEDLIKKKGLLDPLADDDDIDWKTNPFDKDAIVEQGETPEQLMSMITFEGSSHGVILLGRHDYSYRLWYWWLHVFGHQRISPSRTIRQEIPHRITVELVCEREGILWHILWCKTA